MENLSHHLVRQEKVFNLIIFYLQKKHVQRIIFKSFHNFIQGICISGSPALAPNLYLPALAPNLYLPDLVPNFHLPALVPNLYLPALTPNLCLLALAPNLC